MAIGGAAVGVAGVLGALQAEGPAPRWVLRLFAAWCVIVPYWWYLEYRLLAPTEAAGRARFDARQAHSRTVWLGFVLAMAVPILAR